jgi:type II secretory pathway component PulJ
MTHKQTAVHGFTLIELIVGTLIASLICGVLLTALSQSSRVQASVDNTIDISDRISIAAHQLHRDLDGAFVPRQAEKMDDEKKDLQQPNQKGDKKEEPADKKDEKVGQKKEEKPIEKIFYSTNKNGMLDTLTFITNNPLVVFVGKDVGTIKPKVVRVQYTLKPEANNKDVYTLFRQESNELDLAEYKNVRPYEVMSGIKKLSIQFTARIEKKQEQQKPSTAAQQNPAEQQKPEEKPKKSYEYKVQQEWVSEPPSAKASADTTAGTAADKSAEKKEAEFPRIPYSVEFKMTLWDKQTRKEKDFIIVCDIPVDSIEAENKAEEQKKQKPKQQPQPEPGNKSDKNKSESQAVNRTVTTARETIVVSNDSIEEALDKAMDSIKKMFNIG